MKEGDRIITNKYCDMPNIKGTVLKVSSNSVCCLVHLDNGFKLLTMGYAVDEIREIENGFIKSIISNN